MTKRIITMFVLFVFFPLGTVLSNIIQNRVQNNEHTKQKLNDMKQTVKTKFQHVKQKR